LETPFSFDIKEEEVINIEIWDKQDEGDDILVGKGDIDWDDIPIDTKT